jgi:RES domain-containing protein
MPAGIPPKGDRPQPRFIPLPAGSMLWTVMIPAADPFRPPPTELEMQGARWGGRFDPTPDCPYPYCYAALDDLTALSEALLRDVRMDAPARYLPRHALAGRTLAVLETVRELWLVSLLDGPDLAAARQDAWLVYAESREFPRTQLWAHWLRDCSAPDGAPPAGIVWPSKRQPGGRALLLFGDRSADAVLRSPHGERRLDDDEGRSWVNRRLALLRTRLAGAS